MIKSGDAARDYVDTAVRHLKLKQGVLGIKVKIMMPYDPSGKAGVATKQPDVIKVFDPKEVHMWLCGCCARSHVLLGSCCPRPCWPTGLRSEHAGARPRCRRSDTGTRCARTCRLRTTPCRCWCRLRHSRLLKLTDTAPVACCCDWVLNQQYFNRSYWSQSTSPLLGCVEDVSHHMAVLLVGPECDGWEVAVVWSIWEVLCFKA